MFVSFQFLQLLSEEGDATTPEGLDKESALSKAIDASAMSMNDTTPIADSPSGDHGLNTRSQDDVCEIMETSALLPLKKQPSNTLEIARFEQPLAEANLIGYEKKMAVLYALVAACVADTDKSRQGYDARHRVALRLLAVWLDVKWNEMVRVLGTLACISNTIWYYIELLKDTFCFCLACFLANGS